MKNFEDMFVPKRRSAAQILGRRFRNLRLASASWASFGAAQT